MNSTKINLDAEIKALDSLFDPENAMTFLTALLLAEDHKRRVLARILKTYPNDFTSTVYRRILTLAAAGVEV